MSRHAEGTTIRAGGFQYVSARARATHTHPQHSVELGSSMFMCDLSPQNPYSILVSMLCTPWSEVQLHSQLSL